MSGVRVIVDAVGRGMGGALTHLREVLPRMAALEPSSRWLVCATPEMQGVMADAPPNVERLDLPARFGNYGLRGLFDNGVLQFYAARFKADVAFCPLPFFGLWTTTPAVSVFQNVMPFDRVYLASAPLRQRVRALSLRRVVIAQARRMAETICISEHGREVLARHAGPRLAGAPVIPHGSRALPPDPRAPELLAAAGVRTPFVLFPSHVYRYKHVLEAAEGFLRHVAPREPKLELVVAGETFDGPYIAEVRRLCATYPDGARVRFIGSVDSKTLSAMYRASAAMIFPSRSENCPNILLEGLAHGCAMAVSDWPPMPEFAGEAAIYFDVRSADEMGLAMRTILEQPAAAARLRAAALERSRRYTWEACASATLEVLTRVGSGVIREAA